MRTFSIPSILVIIINILFFSAEVKAQLTTTVTTSNYNGYEVSCFGEQDGSISIAVSGGMPPYTFEWSNAAGNTSVLTDLPAGYYHAHISDNNNNSASVEITLHEPESYKISVDPYVYPNGRNTTCYFCTNGIITVTPLNGLLPITYLWSDGATTGNRTGLSAGDYIVTATDNNGCIYQTGAGILAPDRDDWTMNGNSGSNPSNNFIGTLDNKDVVFKTNSVERLRLKSNGETKFSNLTGTNTFNYLYVDQNGILKKGPGNPNVPTCGNPVMPWYSLDPNLTSVFLCNTTRVGIGTQTPDAYLHLNTPDYKALQITLNNSVYSGNAIEINDQVNNSLYRIRTDGSVFNSNVMGVNTASVPTGYTLAVKGKIIAEEIFVKLYASWPDYVFHDSYSLMPLNELKEFINKNKHLPDMPSASTIEKEEGVTLGEMNVHLTKKVEELTLYIIQQHDRLELLEQKLKELTK